VSLCGADSWPYMTVSIHRKSAFEGKRHNFLVDIFLHEDPFVFLSSFFSVLSSWGQYVLNYQQRSSIVHSNIVPTVGGKLAVVTKVVVVGTCTCPGTTSSVLNEVTPRLSRN
jgi:hypothetical protein